MPITSNLHGLGRRQSYRKVIALQMAIAGGVGLLVAMVIAICSPVIVAAYGAEFRGAEPVIIMLAATAVLIVLENVVGNDMLSRGKVWIGTLFCVLVSAAMILLSKWLVPLYGARGLALAMLPVLFPLRGFHGGILLKNILVDRRQEPLAETPRRPGHGRGNLNPRILCLCHPPAPVERILGHCRLCAGQFVFSNISLRGIVANQTACHPPETGR